MSNNLLCYNGLMKLLADTNAEIEVKKSRFLCTLHRTSSLEEARAFIRQKRKEHPQARHACSAMIIHGQAGSSDDGEPSGTAGRPMLAILQSAGLDDVVCVVIRYFGGTLLGTGGLVRAYSEAVKKALNKAILTMEKTVDIYAIRYPYTLEGKISAWKQTSNIEILEENYTDMAELLIAIDPENTKTVLSTLASATSGQVQPAWIGQDIQEIPA